MTKTIGVIGLGSIGMRHAKNLQVMGHRVVGHDPNENIKDFNNAHPENMLDRCDGIVIASPTYLHEEHIHECLLAKKPFFVEKPLKDKLTDRGGIEATMVGYNLRFHSCVKQAKEWIDGGMIGAPLWGNFTVAQYSNKSDYLRDGVILNWSHEIDLALYLVGPAQVRSCAAINRESLADIILSHENGCQSVVHLDYVTQPEIRQSIIVGSEASIIMDLVNRHAWLKGADGTIWDHLEGQDSWDENYVEEMECFVDRLDGKETLGCTGEEGLRALEICLQAKSLTN